MYKYVASQLFKNLEFLFIVNALSKLFFLAKETPWLDYFFSTIYYVQLTIINIISFLSQPKLEPPEPTRTWKNKIISLQYVQF